MGRILKDYLQAVSAGRISNNLIILMRQYSLIVFSFTSKAINVFNIEIHLVLWQ